MSLTRRGRVLVLLLTLVLFLAIPAGGGYLYLRSIGVYGSSDPGQKVVVVVPKGASAGEVGDILEGKGVIKSSFGFRIANYLDGGFDDVLAGRYEIAQGLTARDALKELIATEPASEEFSTATFPEGSWLLDFGRILEKETDLSGPKFYKLVSEAKVDSGLLPEGIDTLEGLLFPSTYQIGLKENEKDVAQKLIDEMEAQAEKADLASAESLGVSGYEALIVASLVEAEAKVDDDRAKIARVIYNRLEAKMPLQVDATVYYALGRRGGGLTVEDLAVESPYNTRVVTGLPPTPIGAPGAASLEAAANPADGDWLYYVLSADCEHHAFSESYDEFLANKDLYEASDCG
jgi:UPF0755 protein